MQFTLPKQKKLLFFDIVDDLILKNFNEDSFTIFNLRKIRSNLNFFILIKIFFSPRLIKILIIDGLFISYVCSYIEYVKVKKVITFIDNNIRFYRLKHYFKNVKFISVQNGARHKFMDLFGNPNLNNNLICDEILVFGDSIKKEYQKHINATVKTVGCFRNNHNKIFKLKQKNTLLFISQYRDFPENKIMSHFGRNITTWGKLNSNLYILLPNLLKYCKNNHLKFGILSTTGSKREYEYFKKILGRNIYWEFYKPKNLRESYKILDMNEIIVNVWSTMGLESLSRGNKTCFFKQKDFGFNDRHFGWPKKYVDPELFFSSKYDYVSVSKILNKMKLINLDEWKKVVNRYSKDNLIFDSRNNKLINLIKD